MTTKQVCEYLGISRPTLHRRIVGGDIIPLPTNPVYKKSVANHFRRFLVARRRNARLERGMSQFVDEADTAMFEPVAADSSPSDQAQQLETSLRLEAAVERLPGDYRQVIALRTLEGLSFAEIAQRMGRSVDSVQKLWGRGLVQLRKAIDER